MSSGGSATQVPPTAHEAVSGPGVNVASHPAAPSAVRPASAVSTTTTPLFLRANGLEGGVMFLLDTAPSLRARRQQRRCQGQQIASLHCGQAFGPAGAKG